ncbi:MAG: ribosome maturation factor RimP [Lachnospiraceae bacterium]|nr:ribosome maturation factor RimP [Lachnospiraceae bacterium]
MTKREEYEKKTTDLLMPIIERNDCELVDVEFAKEAGTFYLRAIIDKEGGFTVNDCETVSRELSDLLDQKDFINESYILEVSSPGLDRPLKKENDYKRSLGKDVEIKLYKAIEKQKEFEGQLKSYTEDTVTILINNEEKTFEKKDISLIRPPFHC